MDLLGQAVAAMRTGDPRAARAVLHPPWGLRFPAAGAAGVHVVLRGQGWLMLPGEEPMLLQAGEVALVRRDVEHALADDPRSPLHDASADHYEPATTWPPGTVAAGDGPGTVLTGGTYYLRSARPHPLFQDLPRVVRLPRDVVESSHLRAVVELLGTELEQDRPGASAALPAVLDLLLVYTLRTWFMRLEPTTGWSRALGDPATARVLEIIQTRWAEPWTLATLAHEVGLSRASLARRFAQTVGRSPIAYLGWWRMNHAMTLLRRGGPIAPIASEVGYASEFTFAKAFKRETGVAPGRYRRAALTGG